MKKTKVAVALSGGLDSSVTCWLLKNQGYDVVSVTAKMVNDQKFEQIAENAKKVSDKLEIKHYVIDLSKEFQRDVIDYFEKSYKEGKTPNPCIMCNRTIKWGRLFDFAIDELGCDYVASGHYAKIADDHGIKKLYPAKDEKKDQQYYLFELNQKLLSKIMFPLSEYTKDEIRALAVENNLPSKSSKESQDICFISKPMTTKKYITEKLGQQKGDFILVNTDKKLGVHDGFYQYTIGQRKGIGIAYEEPLYVVRLDAQKNIVYVGTKKDLLKSSLSFNDLSLQYPFTEKEFDANVKIRYNMEAKKARVFLDFERNCGHINFYEPVSSVTSGQAAVFYDINDKHLIGGGWIE